MWWDLLPVTGIIFGLTFVPAISWYVGNTLSGGTPYRRPILSPFHCIMYLRDERISGVGDPYVLKGLENLDESCMEPVEKAEKAKC